MPKTKPEDQKTDAEDTEETTEEKAEESEETKSDAGETPPTTSKTTKGPAKSSDGSPGVDLDKIGSAVGRGVAGALRELGIGQTTPPAKSEEKPKEKKSDDGDTGDRQPRRKHWLFGD